MSQADITRGLKALASSKEAYELAEGYYTGEVAEYFANSRIKRHLGDGGKAFRIPFSAIPVDARVDMIDVARITVDQARLQPLVDAIVEANDLDTELIEVYRKAAYFGDFYVLAWLSPDDDADEADDVDGDPTLNDDDEEMVDPTEVDAARSGVEVYLNSPLQFRVIYSNENAREPLFAIKVWEADNSDPGTDAKAKKRWRANLYYRDRVEQWVSIKGKGDSNDGGDFEPYAETGDPEDAVIENPFGEFPFFHFRQGGKPYGVPVHRRAFGPQDALTKLNATHMATVDYIGFPQRYAVRKTDDGDSAPDDDFTDFLPNGGPNQIVDPRSTVDPTRGRSKLKAGPGEMWWLEGVDAVGQFETSGADAFLDPMKFQIAAMARLTSTPADEFQTDDVATPPSGEARRRSREALYKAVRTMEKSYGATTSALLEFCLGMLGYSDAKVTVTFAPLDMMSGVDDWTMIESKLKNGVPLRTVLIEAGYSEEDIEEWYPSDAPALSLSQITTIAAALSGLSAAGATLGFGAETIRAILPEFFVGSDQTEPVRPPIDVTDLGGTEDEDDEPQGDATPSTGTPVA